MINAIVICNYWCWSRPTEGQRSGWGTKLLRSVL